MYIFLAYKRKQRACIIKIIQHNSDACYGNMVWNSKTKTVLQRTTVASRKFHLEPQEHCNSIAQQRSWRYTFPTLLKDCAAALDLNHGKKMHSSILQMGLQSDCFISSSLINMYAKCGSLSDACKVFYQLPWRDASLWNTMLAAYFCCHYHEDGLALLFEMQLAGFKPDGHAVSTLIGACAGGCLDIVHGRQVHAFAVRNLMVHCEAFLEAALINMYMRWNEVEEAHKVFDMSSNKNVYIWNAMVGGLSQRGFWEKSMELFLSMRSENVEMKSLTLSSVLTACSMGEVLDFGEGVHSCVIRMGFELDPYVGTSILTMYAKCGRINEAREVFNSFPVKELAHWNSMISAYVGYNISDEALGMYSEMLSRNLRPDSYTISSILSICRMTGHIDLGMKIHGELIKRPDLNDWVVLSSLITMYMRSGDNKAAEELFNSGDEWDIIVWGSMISGCCQNNDFDYALELFLRLRRNGLRPDSAIMASILSVCGCSLDSAKLGCQVHGHTLKNGTDNDVYVGSALIDMYAKSGHLTLARTVFNLIPYKNLAVWNSLISGYSHNSLLDEAIRLFAEITEHALLPDSISITSVLASASSVTALLKGKMIHTYQLRRGVNIDIQVQHALIDMYMKCGCLNYAEDIFKELPFRNVVAWNTMISGFGSSGNCHKAVMFFEEMKISGVLPDDTTFLSLISSCSHSGLVEEALKIFQSMIRDYNIEPRMEHYASLVDVFGRSGQLEEAYNYILSMPIESGESIWLLLLSACRAYKHKYLGQLVANHILQLKPQSSGTYTQLLNFFGEMGMLDKAAYAKLQMKEIGLKKTPGCSWIELKDEIHLFYSGGSSSLLPSELYVTLMKSFSSAVKEHEELYC